LKWEDQNWAGSCIGPGSQVIPVLKYLHLLFPLTVQSIQPFVLSLPFRIVGALLPPLWSTARTFLLSAVGGGVKAGGRCLLPTRRLLLPCIGGSSLLPSSGADGGSGTTWFCGAKARRMPASGGGFAAALERPRPPACGSRTEHRTQ
jgi:hypothetical protein